LGPKNFEGVANAPSAFQLNLWALQTVLSPMAGMEEFLSILEKTCSSRLGSEEIQIELTGDEDSVTDRHLLKTDVSPWLTGLEPKLPSHKAFSGFDLELHRCAA
jgi:hypothetical protein